MAVLPAPGEPHPTREVLPSSLQAPNPSAKPQEMLGEEARLRERRQLAKVHTLLLGT